MSLARTTTAFVHRHLLWFLLSAYALAAVLPGPGLWIRVASVGTLPIGDHEVRVSWVMVLLAILMFNAGLGVKVAHLRAVLQKRWLVVAGLGANFAVPLLYIFTMNLFMRAWHNPEETQHILIGLALVAAMPIAGASTAWTQNSNGNLALSLGLVLSSTLLSPLTAPICNSG